MYHKPIFYPQKYYNFLNIGEKEQVFENNLMATWSEKNSFNKLFEVQITAKSSYA